MSEQNHSIDNPANAGPDSRTLKRVGIGAAVVAIVVVAFGITSRINATNELRETATEAALPN